jgi:hypothetical protein
VKEGAGWVGRMRAGGCECEIESCLKEGAGWTKKTTPQRERHLLLFNWKDRYALSTRTDLTDLRIF